MQVLTALNRKTKDYTHKQRSRNIQSVLPEQQVTKTI